MHFISVKRFKIACIVQLIYFYVYALLTFRVRIPKDKKNLFKNIATDTIQSFFRIPGMQIYMSMCY